MARFARRFAVSTRCRLPALVLFTDDERLGNALPSIGALPRGSMVILRHRNMINRHALAQAVAHIAWQRRLIWLVADDALAAAKFGADGVHFPETKIGDAAHWRARRPDWVITCAAHSLRACAKASRAGADTIFLAPVFATRSHPHARTLGPLRASLIAKLVPAPIHALGGINTYTAKRLASQRFSGIAAIDALAVD